MNSIFPPAQKSVVRVLLVEDEPKLRQSLVEGLQLEQWAVTGVSTGAEALRQTAVQSFDLIVLDWMLPDCDGLEIVRRLRESANRVPVLMITARAAHADKATVLKSGATDYLAKPFAFDELLGRCRTLLGALN